LRRGEREGSFGCGFAALCNIITKQSLEVQLLAYDWQHHFQ